MSATVEVREKKEKSSKKRKSDAIVETKVEKTEIVESAPADAKKVSRKKSSKISKRSKDISEVTNDEPVVMDSVMEDVEVEVAEPIPAMKEKKSKSSKEKGKSSKKRKVTELEDGNKGSVSPDVEVSEVEEGSEPASKKRKSSLEEIEVDVTAPVPPSKKALRLLKKGKPLPPAKSGAESTPEPEAKKEVEKRSEYGIWIGNLSWSVSKDDLRKFFVELSDLTDDLITRIHMPGPDDNKSANKVEPPRFGKKQHNKGFAYVDFKTAEAVEQAIELSEELLTGRRVLIKNAKSFEGRPEKTKEEKRLEGKPPNKRVFVGNLRFDTTEESLKEHFATCGPIESAMVATFEDSGKCKGYAWVVFEELTAAESAVRGFLHVAEVDSDASSSESESEASDDDEDAESAPKKPKKVKTRKVWVNRIQGRPLRVEFAEDAQVRYKKRYGKDGTKQSGAAGARVSGSGAGEGQDGGEAPAAGVMKPTKVVEYRKPYAARLTGGIVESKGKKTTF